ncbi:chemotaxis protein CheA [Sphingomonas sp. CGMCC 1.13654]|uniref:Chemotaxis protein CheA n=1 Tax=Sphingomonas chungangi TaxID=2683589 RepID=A0A838LAM1_9SPHN|nr:chemotaxis protein CheA [Sphingomonas chungangi]MBA2935176.1 chemotaxis protein CheA [Sphingomonas chungangi]MVW55254.1 chemotaxis protein CheA [Sphingomonas chungangi]
MDELLAQFLIEARELVPEALAALEGLRQEPGDAGRIDAAFRAIHTLKGSVALFDMAPAGRILHAAEDLLEGARANRVRLDLAPIATLVACLDRVDAWVDAMETEGRLPHDAGTVAARLLLRFGGSEEDAGPEPITSQAVPDWVTAILDREAASVKGAAGDLVAFRYTPDAACFFRGDDPLALVAAIPETLALAIRPRDPWPEADVLDPFHCNLVLEGLSAAPMTAVQAVLRVVGEQAAVFAMPRQMDEVGVAYDAVRTFRIDERRIDSLVDHVGELVVIGNSLASIVANAAQSDTGLGPRLRAFQTELDRGILAMQRSVIAVRLVPVGPAVRRLPRLVRDIADTLGKDVAFVIEGEAIEVDKAIADILFEPLLHLVRNALDHGIEAPERRIAAGKPAQGRLRLRFARSGEQLHVSLKDDGAGIDPARIRAIAVERGIVTGEGSALLDDRSATHLIFSPGFSTCDQVSDVSGRGVGMDAVRRAVEAAGGRIEVESAIGAGSTMLLVLPLSAITTRLLVVAAGEDRYAIPFDRIAETATVSAEQIVPVGGGEALVLRDATVPLLHLSELVGRGRAPSERVRLVVTHMNTERIALAIDAFGERVDSMVRPVSGLLATVPGIAGTTLMSNGEVLLVLDPERLIG